MTFLNILVHHQWREMRNRLLFLLPSIGDEQKFCLKYNIYV